MLARSKTAAPRAGYHSSVFSRLLRRPNSVDVPDDLGSVTSPDAAEERDVGALGLTRDGLERIWSAVEALYRTGVHPAIALCVRRRGVVVLDRAIGHASGNAPGDPPGAPKSLATEETSFCLFSASKAVTAMLIHHLDDEGLLHIDDRVADYLPEFARHGKERTTIRHVLTHRAGIPSLPSGKLFDLDLLARWDRIVELLCDATPVWAPGRRLAYHAVTGGFILGEIVRRVTGKDVRRALEDSLLRPLGFRGMTYGAPSEARPRIARNAYTGIEVPFPLSALVRRSLGVGFREATEVSNDPRWLDGIVPSGNVVGTANEVSRFYQLLLNEGELDGTRVMDPRTVRRARNETSYLELDLTLGAPIRYGLGFMLGAEWFSLFGPGTPQAFGHIGFTQMFTWADPARQLAVALLTSGKPFPGLHVARLYGVLAAIARGCPPG